MLPNELPHDNSWPHMFSATAIEHMENPQNAGSIEHPDGFGTVTGTCGDNMEIWLKISNGAIDEIKFWTDGCETTIAAGSMTTLLAKGKPIGIALKISEQDILVALDGFPEDGLHCISLAVKTLRAAIDDYLEFKNDPWKRLY
jgi:nitrogen fixation NifU-like protein